MIFLISQVSKCIQVYAIAHAIISKPSIRISYPKNGKPANRLEIPRYDANVMLQAGHPVTKTDKKDPTVPMAPLF